MFIPSCLCKQDLYDYYDALQIMKQDAYVKYLCAKYCFYVLFLFLTKQICINNFLFYTNPVFPFHPASKFPMFFFLGKKFLSPKRMNLRGIRFPPPHAGFRDSKTKTPEIRKAKALGSLRRIKNTHEKSDLG